MKFISKIFLSSLFVFGMLMSSCTPKEMGMDSADEIVGIPIDDDVVSTKCTLSEAVKTDAVNWVVMLYENGSAVGSVGDYHYPMVFSEGESPRIYLYSNRTYNIYVLANVPASGKSDLQSKADSYWSAGNSSNLSKELTFSYNGLSDYKAIKSFGYVPRASSTLGFCYAEGSTKVNAPVPLVHQVTLSVSKDREDVKVVSGGLFGMARSVFPFSDNHVSSTAQNYFDTALTDDEVDSLNNYGFVSLWCLENRAGYVSSVSSREERIPDLIGSMANRATRLQLRLKVGQYSAVPDGIATIKFYLGEANDVTSFNCLRNTNTELLLRLNSSKLSSSSPSSWLVEKEYKHRFQFRGSTVYNYGEQIEFFVNSDFYAPMLYDDKDEYTDYTVSPTGDGWYRVSIDPLPVGKYYFEFGELADVVDESGSDWVTISFSVVKAESDAISFTSFPEFDYVPEVSLDKTAYVAQKKTFETNVPIGSVEFDSSVSLPYSISGNQVTFSLTQAGFVKFRLLNKEGDKYTDWFSFVSKVPNLRFRTVAGQSSITLSGTDSGSSVYSLSTGHNLRDFVVVPVSGNYVDFVYVGIAGNVLDKEDSFDVSLYDDLLKVSSVSPYGSDYIGVSSCLAADSQYPSGFKLHLRDVVSIPSSAQMVSLIRGIGNVIVRLAFNAPIIDDLSTDILNKYLLTTGEESDNYSVPLEFKFPVYSTGNSLQFIDDATGDDSCDYGFNVIRSNSLISGFSLNFDRNSKGIIDSRIVLKNYISNNSFTVTKRFNVWLCKGIALCHFHHFNGTEYNVCPVFINYRREDKLDVLPQHTYSGTNYYFDTPHTDGPLVFDYRINSIRELLTYADYYDFTSGSFDRYCVLANCISRSYTEGQGIYYKYNVIRPTEVRNYRFGLLDYTIYHEFNDNIRSYLCVATGFNENKPKYLHTLSYDLYFDCNSYGDGYDLLPKYERYYNYITNPLP